MKKSVNDLAYFGGSPLFANPLHVGSPNVGDRDKLNQRVSSLLDSNQLTNGGPFVKELERKLSDYLGVKHVIAMCNGTVALEITVRALNLTGEVIVPSFTFIATCHALKWQQLHPVFADIDINTHRVCPRSVEKSITEDTTGIVAVNLWGQACEVELLQKIAERHNLKLIFDSAHAFAASHNRKMIGGFGDAEVFSFHATKVFNTFEGGAVATNNDELADKIRLMQNFGFSGWDNVIYIGTNGKMSEVSAAMGLTSLDSIDTFININKENFLVYKDCFKDITGLKIIDYDHREKNNYHYVVFELNEEKFGISRDKLVDILHAENILARKYFYPGCHNMEPYKTEQSSSNVELKNTEFVASRVIVFPTGRHVTKDVILQISALLRLILANVEKINAS